MEEGVREGNEEKVSFCIFYELFYNVIKLIALPF